jgi:phenylacetate-CoA ligase
MTWMMLRKAQLDIWRARWADTDGIRARQEHRLADLVSFARRQSRFYGRHHAQFPDPVGPLNELPAVTKPMLMEHFDDVVTDPAITKSRVDAFLADQTNLGRRFLGRYPVWTTSGTTGEPGVFIQDDFSLMLVHTVPDRWTTPALFNFQMMRRVISNNRRFAEIAFAGGHFAGASGIALFRRESRLGKSRIRFFSATQPIDELVADLNHYQLALIIGYSTVLVQLAHAQQKGRLAISPPMIVPTAEPISGVAKRELRETFGCVVREMYSATEAISLSTECSRGSLHANADWFLLEPVDDAYRVVEPGQASNTVLLTHLGNRVQPLIRYDLGDAITMHRDTCSCGSAFPVIEVQGRQGEVLVFQSATGQQTMIFPLALTGIIEAIPDVARSQIVRTGPSVLEVRFETKPGRDEAATWKRIAQSLGHFLDSPHLSDVRVEQGSAPLQRHPRSGKYRHVWTANL